VIACGGAITRIGSLAFAMLVAVAGCSGGGTEGEDAMSQRPADTSTTTTSAAITRALPTTMEQAPGLPGYNVYRPTDLATARPASGPSARSISTHSSRAEPRGWKRLGVWVAAAEPDR
jgi:hypothetical protein